MTQVICPGCAKLIEVGVLPPGTLPSCPYCRTVFQLPAGASAEAGQAAIDPSSHGRPSPGTSSPGTRSLDTPAPRTWRTAAWGLALVSFAGGLLATFLLLAITLLSDREKKKGEPKNQPLGWQVVGDFSGHTHLQTRSFRVESSVWRMTWSCEANQTSDKKTFRVHVMDELGKLVGTPVTAQGSDQGAATMETEPGRYYLSIQATNVRWELKVEHQP